MTTPTFIHLRLHTEYSIVDGIVRIKPLMKRLAELNMPAVAMTDESNLFGLVKFQRAAEASGIKPIFGSDIWVQSSNEKNGVFRLSLLVQNQLGYLHLTQLLSKAYTEGQILGKPVVRWHWLEKYGEGLILLSGAAQGELGHLLLANKKEEAKNLLHQFMAIFPERFYIEVQRTGKTEDENLINATVSLAHETECPIVATNEVRFIHSEDFDAHEVKVCIHEGRILEDEHRPRIYTDQQYLRSAEEMQELFSDLPEALANSVEIAKRCTVHVPLDIYHLPNYPTPRQCSVAEYLTQQAQEGLLERLKEKVVGREAFTSIDYQNRLDEELKVINSMGFAGYFLIVMDFIRWAKNNGVPVGPGRGSGAGSLVAYALRITDLDPLVYGLLFERFLNPERVSLPDFDIDFCMEGRDRVIEYVANTYGREAVSQIITFGSMAAKAVVRDVGRALGKGYGFVDRIAKLIPFELGITLTKALEDEEQLKTLYTTDEEVKEILDMALKLEGLTRNAGKHAGGVVIAPSKLTDFAPLYCDAAGEHLVTQFDKDDVEAVGLVKFDFLGLRTLTIIDWAVRAINQKKLEAQEPLLNITELPLNDTATFKLLQSAETTAIFQLESRGMKDLIKRLQPSCFEDIVALVALFRPGPLQSGMVDDFINRKHGRQKVEYPHPDVEPILKNTYGVILYQEQVMQIAQVLSGYTLGGADMLRRAMGKKKAEEMAKQREIFTEGAVARGVLEQQATHIFDLMEKFAGYGFNKSHSAAYALLSYQTAWLKAHYPAEFMAAVLSADMDNTDKVVILAEECRSMKLELVSPHVNYSSYKFVATEPKKIVYGLGAIKGVGEASIDNIIEEKKKKLFTDLFDFCQRVDLRKVNRRCLEALIRSGAMEDLGSHRAAIWASLEDAIKAAEQLHSNEASGIQDLFGASLTTPATTEQAFKVVPAWSDKERLLGEKETLGLYLTGHPIDQYLAELRAMKISRLQEVKPTQRGHSVIIAGLLIGVRTMKNKRQEKIAFATLDDRSARIDVTLFADVYAAAQNFLIKDELCIVEGEVSLDTYSGQLKMIGRNIISLSQLRSYKKARIVLKATSETMTDVWVEKLKTILQSYQAEASVVCIHYHGPESTVQLELGSQWRVNPEQTLLDQLKRHAGDENVLMEYS